MKECRCSASLHENSGKVFQLKDCPWDGLFLLAQVSAGKFRLVSLEDGNRWNDNAPDLSKWEEVKVCYKRT